MGLASSSSAKAICYFLCILVALVSSENTICPFHFLYHFGDGVFDNGNGIRRLPDGPSLPAARLPYGKTFPGYPTGRFSDGRLDIDYGGMALGFPQLTPYLGGNASNNSAIIFAVVSSPVLNSSFFTARGVELPTYVASLEVQMGWFKEYLNYVCSTPTECANILGNSFFLFGDCEANDLTFPLLQGKSIQEVETYVPFVNQAQIDAAREAIRMGATRIVLPGNVPIGCYPFILTELSSDDPAAYDDLGCLKNINDLIQFKNNDLQNSINNLTKEFPNVTIFYSDFYNGFLTILREWNSTGPAQDMTLKACCGSGGNYNYNNNTFCGSEGVYVCDDPSRYIHWDGIHLTDEANDRLSIVLQQGALELLNCTTSQLLEKSQFSKTSQLLKAAQLLI